MSDPTVSRCLKCILPISFPGLQWREGVCSFCNLNIGVRKKRQGLSDSIKHADRILVALSGGRDSCFGLHYLKKNTNAEIIAFTYDWPLVHPRARRNASRMVSALNIEHVLRVPDSFAQLKYIRKIVKAIAKKPDARAIPLLLAPDKFFFQQAHRVGKKYQADVIVFCSGNELEFTAFKTSVVGANSNDSIRMLGLSSVEVVRLFFGMCNTFIFNPRLFLAGLSLPFRAFVTTYLTRPKIEYLYEQIEWDEGTIEETLSFYEWEGLRKSEGISQWRSGDGTVEFYNYLYLRLLGFNERTTNLANRVRNGFMSREQALKLEEENASPDLEALRDYSSVVGFQLDEFLRDFNRNIKKM